MSDEPNELQERLNEMLTSLSREEEEDRRTTLNLLIQDWEIFASQFVPLGTGTIAGKHAIYTFCYWLVRHSDWELMTKFEKDEADKLLGVENEP